MNRHFLEHQMTEPLRNRRELNIDFYTRPIDDHFFDELTFYNRDFFSVLPLFFATAHTLFYCSFGNFQVLHIIFGYKKPFGNAKIYLSYKSNCRFMLSRQLNTARFIVFICINQSWIKQRIEGFVLVNCIFWLQSNFDVCKKTWNCHIHRNTEHKIHTDARKFEGKKPPLSYKMSTYFHWIDPQNSIWSIHDKM